MKAVVPLIAMAVLAACATGPRTGEMGHYRCADGTAFSLEVANLWVRLHTVTGPIELPRESRRQALYTNGLRTVIVDDDGTVRHAVRDRAFVECRQVSG